MWIAMGEENRFDSDDTNEFFCCGDNKGELFDEIAAAYQFDMDFLALRSCETVDDIDAYIRRTFKEISWFFIGEAKSAMYSDFPSEYRNGVEMTKDEFVNTILSHENVTAMIHRNKTTWHELRTIQNNAKEQRRIQYEKLKREFE